MPRHEDAEIRKIRELTLRKDKGPFLAPGRDSTVELARSGRVQLDLVL
jgi:hypothetical protein